MSSNGKKPRPIDMQRSTRSRADGKGVDSTLFERAEGLATVAIGGYTFKTSHGVAELGVVVPDSVDAATAELAREAFVDLTLDNLADLTEFLDMAWDNVYRSSELRATSPVAEPQVDYVSRPACCQEGAATDERIEADLSQGWLSVVLKDGSELRVNFDSIDWGIGEGTRFGKGGAL